MDRRAINRLAVLPHGEPVGDTERLSMTDHHPVDLTARHPRPHPGVHPQRAHADLILRPALVTMRSGRQAALVRPPPKLGRRDAFFIKSFDRPGVHEFVHLLGVARDLRVALADVNDFDARELGELRKIPRKK